MTNTPPPAEIPDGPEELVNVSVVGYARELAAAMSSDLALRTNTQPPQPIALIPPIYYQGIGLVHNQAEAAKAGESVLGTLLQDFQGQAAGEYDPRDAQALLTDKQKALLPTPHWTFSFFTITVPVNKPDVTPVTRFLEVKRQIPELVQTKNRSPLEATIYPSSSTCKNYFEMLDFQGQRSLPPEPVPIPEVQKPEIPEEPKAAEQAGQQAVAAMSAQGWAKGETPREPGKLARKADAVIDKVIDRLVNLGPPPIEQSDLDRAFDKAFPPKPPRKPKTD